MASVAPAVTSTSVSGSYSSPYHFAWCSAMAARSSGIPGPGGYWLCPARMAATAASSTSGGPSASGKPWPRLIEPVATASADISAKIVVPKPCSRETRYGRVGHAQPATKLSRTCRRGLSWLRSTSTTLCQMPSSGSPSLDRQDHRRGDDGRQHVVGAVTR